MREKLLDLCVGNESAGGVLGSADVTTGFDLDSPSLRCATSRLGFSARQPRPLREFGHAGLNGLYFYLSYTGEFGVTKTRGPSSQSSIGEALAAVATQIIKTHRRLA